MTEAEINRLEKMMAATVKEAATTAAVDALKASDHSYPSDACKLLFTEMLAKIDKRLDAIENKLTHIESNMNELLADHAELDKRVEIIEGEVTEIRRFQSIQKWVLGSLWGIMTAWIIGGGFFLFKTIGSKLLNP